MSNEDKDCNNSNETLDDDLEALIFPLEKSGAEPMSISEVALLLDDIQASGEAMEENFTEVFYQCNIYAHTFRKFRCRQMIDAIRNSLNKKKMLKSQISALIDLCPETVQEAKILIPSLRDIDDKDLLEIVDDITIKKSISF